jgi:hypothetical protein
MNNKTILSKNLHSCCSAIGIEASEFKSQYGQELSNLHILQTRALGREADHSFPTSGEVKKM